MKSDQQWQVSMGGSETKYSMLKQLFDTAAEIVQGHLHLQEPLMQARLSRL